MRTPTIVLSVVTLTLVGVLPASSQTLVPEGSPDFVAIQQILLDVDSTWNRRDAKGFGDLFLEAADFRFYTGRMLRGREEIEQYFAASFAELPADIRHETRGEQYRYLAPNVIIGESVIFVYPESATEEEAHSRPILSTGIALKRDGRWRLAAVRLMLPQQE